MNIATNKFREGPFPYIMVLARGGSEVGRGDVFPRHDSNFFNLKFGRFHRFSACSHFLGERRFLESICSHDLFEGK